MKTKKVIQYYYIREGFIRSIIADMFTFGAMFSLLFLNYFVLGNKWYLDLLFIWMVLVSASARVTKRMNIFNSVKELKEYLSKVK